MDYIRRILESFGVRLHKSRSLENEKAFYKGTIERIAELYVSTTFKNDFNNYITGIVFSKDRAMQLGAMLSSYFYNTTNPAPLIILFTCSSSVHEDSYQLLQKEFETAPLTFLKETNFQVQLKEIITNDESDRIFFMTDDAIFVDNYDLNDCLLHDPINHIFSLRLGTDLDFCFAYNKAQDLPVFKTASDNSNLKIWNWALMSGSPDWNYPLSLDGTIFFRKEIEMILNRISFTSPNSLESGMQEYKELFLCRKGVCFTKAKYVNIPCNIVQEEFKNRYTDSYSIEHLLKYFLEGKRIDWKNLQGLNAPDVQKTKFTFIGNDQILIN